MDIGIIMKIAGVALLVAVINSILSKAGRDEQVMFVTIAGVVCVLLVLMGYIAELFETVRTVFGL
ncbi:MAG: stage III sporulation protein AC [Eubacteriales bacterium]|nr:stage III sporulation protein AC [Eubacteriales bacterium]